MDNDVTINSTPVIEKRVLIIAGIALFAVGCSLGWALKEQILREILWAPWPQAMVAVRNSSPYIMLFNIALAPGLFLSIPTIAIALAKPSIRSLMLRSATAYLLSTLISVSAGLGWYGWAVTYGRSTLTYESIPVLSVALAGPLTVLVLVALLDSRSTSRKRRSTVPPHGDGE